MRNRDGAAGHHGRSEKRAGVRKVWLDDDSAALNLAWLDAPDGRLGLRNLDAALAQAFDGHVDVGHARQVFALVPERESLVKCRRREQQT